MDARKMMLVIGGEHDGAEVEVEDYTYAVRLPLPFDEAELETMRVGKEPPQRFALYYRSSITLQDETDGSLHQIEFLRAGTMTTRQAVERRLLPEAARTVPGPLDKLTGGLRQ